MWGGWYEPLGNHKAPYVNFTLGRTEFGLNCILSRTMYLGLDVRIDDHLALAWEYGPLNYRKRQPALFFLGHISPIFARFFAVFSPSSPS